MLPKQYRLKRQRDFVRVYQRGRAVSYPAFVLYQKPNGQKAPRVGFSVSKKIGNAVTRNRIKRRFRHGVAELMPSLPQHFDYVFIVRHRALSCNHGALISQMAKALQQIGSAQKAAPGPRKGRQA